MSIRTTPTTTRCRHGRRSSSSSTSSTPRRRRRRWFKAVCIDRDASALAQLGGIPHKGKVGLRIIVLVVVVIGRSGRIGSGRGGVPTRVCEFPTHVMCPRRLSGRPYGDDMTSPPTPTQKLLNTRTEEGRIGMIYGIRIVVVKWFSDQRPVQIKHQSQRRSSWRRRPAVGQRRLRQKAQKKGRRSRTNTRAGRTETLMMILVVRGGGGGEGRGVGIGRTRCCVFNVAVVVLIVVGRGHDRGRRRVAFVVFVRCLLCWCCFSGRHVFGCGNGSFR